MSRTCGDCSFCCWLFKVESLKKSEYTWCEHCQPGKGCVIYDKRKEDARYDICRRFRCEWLRSDVLGPEWQPNLCGMVVCFQRVDSDLYCYIIVDPTKPDVWREERYQSALNKIARDGLMRREPFWTVVYVDKRSWLILPHAVTEITGMSKIVIEEMTGSAGSPGGVGGNGTNLDGIRGSGGGGGGGNAAASTG